MNRHARILCGSAALALGLAGCASTGEPEFGSSVRHMAEGQKYDPSAPHKELGTLDGQTAAHAVEAYHADKKAAAAKSATPAIFVPATQ